jgi:hypothetical protein
MDVLIGAAQWLLVAVVATIVMGALVVAVLAWFLNHPD